MAGDTTITIVGNPVDDPELRFTASGVAVANFRVASTPRIRPPVKRVEGRRVAVLVLLRLAPICRERRWVIDQGHQGDRHRSSQTAVIRNEQR